MIYGFSGAAAKFLAIFTVPVVTRILSKGEYGTVDAALAFSAVFGGFVIFGQDASIARFFYDKDEDQAYRRRVASTGLVIQISLIILGAVVFVFFADAIGYVICSDNSEVVKYWKIAILAIPGSALLLFSINIFKWTFQRGKYLILSLGSAFLNVTLILYLVAYLRLGIMGAIIPNVISSILFSLLGIYLNRHYISFNNIFQDFKLAKEMILYGLPFGGVMILAALMPSMDRLFLIRYTDMSQIGIYAVSMKIGSLLLLIVGAFQIAFGPYAFSIWNKEKASETFAKLFKIYVLSNKLTLAKA